MFLKICNIGGNPWQNFGRRVQRCLTPPRTSIGTWGRTWEIPQTPQWRLRCHKKFHKWKIGGNPWKNYGCQVRCAPLPPVGHPRAGTRYGLLLHHMDYSRGGGGWKNLGRKTYESPPPMAESFAYFWQKGIPVPMMDCTGGGHTHLIHPHPPAHLYLLLHHPLPLKDSHQGGGSHWWEVGSR